MIALDAPETLSPDDVSITLKGWCNAEKRPKSVEIRIAGCTLPTAVKDAQYIDACYPELKAVRYECPVDFSELYRNGEARYSRHLFAVVVIVETEFEQRAFEYIVSQEWVDRVFGSAAKPVAKPRTPDHLMVRVGGSRAVDMSFYPTGQTAVAQMHALLQHRGTDFDELQSILDFGCGCGRVLLALYHEGLPGRLYGSDIDKEAVQWCRENFGSAATFDSNEPLPPTRYAGNSFDLVYAISVFTHLPEDHQDAWLAELRRILKPGGLLLTTIHGPRIHGMLPPELEAAVVKKGFFYVGQADEKWPSYLGAKTDGLPDFYRLTYHTFDYVRKHWSNYFEILNIEEQGLNFLHDAVVCRKPMVAGCVSGSGSGGEVGANPVAGDRARAAAHGFEPKKQWVFGPPFVPPVRQFRLQVPMPPQGRTAGLPKLNGVPVFNLEILQGVWEPFGKAISTIAVRMRDALTLLGWAIDSPGGKVASSIDIAIDGSPYQTAHGGDRPDVAEYFHQPGYLKSGFTFSFPAGHLAPGTHTLTVRVVAADGQGYYESAHLLLQTDAEEPQN